MIFVDFVDSDLFTGIWGLAQAITSRLKTMASADEVCTGPGFWD